MLVVVDYADRWPPSDLLALLTHLTFISQRARATMRVLLLARSSRAWWPAVRARVTSDLRIEASTQELPPLGDQVDRGDLFRDARSRFAQTMDVPDPRGLRPPDALTGEEFAQILAVHMAALVAVDAHRRGARAPTAPHALSAYLLDREEAYWLALHQRSQGPRLPDVPGIRPEVMGRTTYLAAVTNAVPRATAHAALARVGLASTIEAADEVIDAHRHCYPPEDPRLVLEALRPDRLAEDLIALTTPGHPHTTDGGREPDDWVTTAAHNLLATTDDPPPWTSTAVTVLTETAHRWPHIATGMLYPLLRQRPDLALTAGGTTITRLATIPNVDPSVLEAIDALLPPHQHVNLDIAAAAISTALIQTRLAATTDPARKAQLHADHAGRLHNAGQRQETLAPAEEAVAIRRRLAEADPAAHEPDLAASLTSLGVRLWMLERRQEALAPAEEAVAIRRRLAEADPAAHEPGLAASLSNLGVFLVGLGRGRESLAPAEEAAAIRRRLAETNPAAYQPDLAASLNNLSARLWDLGRYREALAPIEEAVAIRRRLAETNPAAYQPDLAASLTILSSCLWDLGRRQEALAPIEEAVAIRRRLAETNPAAHQPDLAHSLNNLSARLADLGRHQEALAPIEEAVAIRRRLAETNPAAHQPDLAISLDNLGIQLADLGRHQEALAPGEEAVKVFRRLTQAEPAAYQPGLATALSNLGVRLSQLGRYPEALASTEEAVAIRRRLAGAEPAIYEPDLATSLGNLGLFLSESGRRQEALAPAEEAVAIRRRLAEAEPAAYEPDLARSLWSYALVCLGLNHDLPGALATAQEAVGIYQRLAEQIPDAFTPLLQAASRTLADVLDCLGRSRETTKLRRRLDM
ncbi:tetratricopeptide repeat protein [Micromonospora sp. ATCC 39149]|uniref:tetratricopeptide repeat protein n=1 Tax=Micromonospora sp. (strain ATCC 39149 / NRRL 15099 / SCC 1413) TaxID=219305 RepID=UPI0021019285|nr:tetratricopeptide repeat protein [Micromonospora sp. ATCC 39149]